jgi:stearoyl-CoA desaturase (Delta-9 desaturase)
MQFKKSIYPWSVLLPAFILAPVLLLTQSSSAVWWIVCAFCFFAFDNLGVQIGVHKLLAHRAFTTTTWITRTLAFLSVLSGQGSPLVWVAVHMGSHHPYSDTEQDIHSPRHGLFYAFVRWYWACDTSKINFRPARIYLQDRVLTFLHNNHALIILAYWLLLAALDLRLLLFAGLLPAVFSIVLAGFVNAFMHSKRRWFDSVFLKYQNHKGDDTFNSVWLGVLTMGLGLHNNHHHNPSALHYSERWYEIDLAKFIVPLIAKQPASKDPNGR